MEVSEPSGTDKARSEPEIDETFDSNNSTSIPENNTNSSNFNKLGRGLVWVLDNVFLFLLGALVVIVGAGVISSVLVLIFSLGNGIGSVTQAWLGLSISLILIGAGFIGLFSEELSYEAPARMICGSFLLIGSAIFMATFENSFTLGSWAAKLLSLFVR